MKKKKNPNQLSLREHTEELRKRVLCSILAYVILFTCFLWFSGYGMEFVFEVGKRVGYEFIYIAPQEVLIQKLRLTGTFAFWAALPIILFQVCKFIAPAIDIKHLNIIMILLVSLGMLMFVMGMWFSYYVLLPFVYSYLYQMGVKSGIAGQISVEKYITLFMTVMICIGCVFEIPLVSCILAKAGLITETIMKRGRSAAIVFSFVFAALITPPDVISQCMVAVPIVVLYQISIWLCKAFKPKR